MELRICQVVSKRKSDFFFFFSPYCKLPLMKADCAAFFYAFGESKSVAH